MKTKFLFAAALAALIATPAVSQTSDTEAAADTLGLSLGSEEVGSSYELERHGDWEMRCLVAPEGQIDPCQLYQLLLDPAGNPVAEFNLFDVQDEGELIAGATIITPLDTLLTAQLRMAVDSSQPRVYPFSFCQTLGCYVRLGLTAAEIQAFERGNEVTIAIAPLQVPDQLIPLTLSLSGFTAGFAALEEYNEAAIAQIQAEAEAAE